MMHHHHVQEASKLVTEYKALKGQLAELETADKLTLSYFSRSIHMDKDDPKFREIINNMKVFLQLRIDNIIRRGNQINLMLEPTVVKQQQPVEQAKPEPIKPTIKWQDEASQLFKK